ncbi:MAG: pilus assembly protein PilP [Deltaproteobacteria bacterium]|nr:pilus assembly protein PilP [Deltaproteobacteria bacterium]
MGKSKFTACGMAVALAVLTSPWGSWGADVPTKAPVPASLPAKAPESAPAKTSPLESYTYNPVGKPDPFLPFIEKDLIVKKKAGKSSRASIFPLQNAGVDQFKLVGIAGNERRRTAVVEDERGKFYTLNEGTYIGQNNGRVKSILADRVIVEEKISLESGGARINRITIKLHKEDNEGKP